ncbi:MAG: hypothetical protein Kow00106_11560 [Anaerolineae bacterium]
MIVPSVLQTVADNLQEGILLASPDSFTIEYASPSAESLCGHHQDELRGQTLSALVPALSGEVLQDFLRSPEIQCYETTGELVTADAMPLRIRARLSRITLDDATHLLCSLHPLNGHDHDAALLRAQRDLAVALSAEDDLVQALAQVVEKAIRLTRMDGGGAYLFDEQTGALVLHYHTGLPEDLVQAVSYLPADSPQARLVRQGAPFYQSYEKLYNRMGISMDDVRRRAGIRVLAVVPIASGQQIIGSLNLSSRTRRRIPPKERHFLETLASQVGHAIARIRAEQARRASEQIVRVLLNATPDSAVLLDRDFVIRAVNTAGAQLLGAPAETLVGRQLLDGVPPQIATLFATQISQVFMSGQPVDFIYDQCERILSITVHPLPGLSGEIEQAAMFGRDITAQHLNEMALHRQHTLLQAIAQATSQLVTIPDLDTAIEQALATLGEASVADWLYIFQIVSDPQSGESFASLAYHWARQGTAHLFNWNDPGLRRISLHGREILIEHLQRGGMFVDANTPVWREYVQVNPLRASGSPPLLLPLFVHDELWGVIGLGHHNPAQTWSEEERHALQTLANALGGTITRHQVIRRLREERDFAETLRDMGMTITSTLDLDSVLSAILQQTRRIVPYDTATVFLIEGDQVRLASRTTIDPQRFPKPLEVERVSIGDFPLLQRLVESREAVVVSDTHHHPQWRITPGAEYIRSWLGVPIITRGQMLGFLALHSAQPGTYQRQHADAVASFAIQAGVALQNAHLFADIQRLERTKSEMIRIASHDLRSPLTRLTMLVNRLLSRSDLNADRAVERDLLRIRDAASEMEQLIDEILSLERIEARHRASEPIDWCDLVRRAVKALQPDVAARSHQLRLDCPQELPLLYGDSAQLYHAAYNLIHNAIKYTPAGGVIEVRTHQGHYGDQTTLVFEVEDNGPGIPPDQQQALFQPFFRVNELAADTPGVGLGLTVVKAAVEAHRGRVYCESTPGQGSLFGFWVPLEG